MITTNSRRIRASREDCSSGNGGVRHEKRRGDEMTDKDKELQTSSSAIVFFTVLSSATAIATAFLPFFLN
jgi:hypothetical protein